jgi:putative PEP-CTERM system histidine kinase
MAQEAGGATLTVLNGLPFVAAALAFLLAVASVMRRLRSPATWCFAAGMIVLGLDNVFTGFSLRSTRPGQVVSWLLLGFLVKSLGPAIWLAFAVTYSRGDFRRFLLRWRLPVALLVLLPIVVAIAGPARLLEGIDVNANGGIWALHFRAGAKAWSSVLIVALVLVLTNLEQTFRATVGTMRWRIKFVVVGFAVIFGTQIYVHGQVILFASYGVEVAHLEAGALVIGCAFLLVAHRRTGWTEVDVYPSLAVLRSSLTVLIVGGYLFAVGVLAQIARRFGGAELLQYHPLIVLAGLSGLAVLLLSDRFRQRVHSFVARHFRRSEHDAVEIWSRVSMRLARVQDQAGLGAVAVKLVSETFDVLSVTLWLLDDDGRLSPAASTVRPQEDGEASIGEAMAVGLRSQSAPVDFEDLNQQWADELRQLNPSTFAHGGHRWCIPIRAGERVLGALVLGDRVNGSSYTIEERELLRCIGDQITSVLLNLRLADELVRAKELEAFRTMSAFFVHDLKNAAASLNLMLNNLPLHFDDPAFRADALRGIGNSARRIEDMIARLTALRQRPALKPVDADLNQLVGEALDRIGQLPTIELTTAFDPVPTMLADREQIQSVVTNLVLNARDALGSAGWIRVRTARDGSRVLLSVADNGCGMSPSFVKESLFRPFQSTKSKGLGIGLFQSFAIVQAHGGSVQVESEPGKGTTFHLSFPAKDTQ